MPSLPALPVPSTDELLLADWLELFALQSADRNSSLGDLERALRRESVLEAHDDQRTQERIAEKLAQVAEELSDRCKASGAAYPFLFNGSTIAWQGDDIRFSPYLFCLLLSTILAKMPKRKQVQPRRLFEDLSCTAAAAYLGGEGLRFAFPRTDLPKNFGEAVTALCRRLGEGQEFKDQPSLQSKDANLDVVAWKHFPDGLPGKLVLFGQCAAGSDWDLKLGALRPDSFCEQWMLEPPPSELLRAFFMPHRVADSRWNWITRQGGVVFDRCRIAYWAVNRRPSNTLDRVSDWVQETLQGVLRGPVSV